MMKNIITKILAWEASIVLRNNRPKIIGITGSSGKSSAKEAVASVLEQKFKVRKSIKSYNSELGLALAILGLKTAWTSPMGWLKNIKIGFMEIFNKEFPEILILEMGVDRPKDFDKLLKIIRPDIGIVTAIGEVPVHVEFFAGPEDVAREKSKLIKALPVNGYAVLNIDDNAVSAMRALTKAKVIGYGFDLGSEVMASNVKLSTQKGTSFKLNYEGSSMPVRLKNVFGKHHIYTVLAATAVGILHKMNLVEIIESLNTYKPPPGRLQLIEGVKNSLILDDSYNASPLATRAALDTLAELEAHKKIFVFGDMLEIGKYTIAEHKAVGARAAIVANLFITVGPRAKFANEEAICAGMDKSCVIGFATSDEAAVYLKSLVQEDDLILIKGSQAMRMERVVEEIMAEPDRASELLCRQDEYWKHKE